jgi:hypothetical protein
LISLLVARKPRAPTMTTMAINSVVSESDGEAVADLQVGNIHDLSLVMFLRDGSYL